MTASFTQEICRVTGASACAALDVIQGLWSGYGQIARYRLEGADWPSVVVKHVKFPGNAPHPRGWDGERSHRRKIQSYRVETAWYEQWGDRCGTACRIPRCLGVWRWGDEIVMVLEDLDASGFAGRRSRVSDRELGDCLSWLAAFHATFMGEKPVGLWDTGTYWHLDTRPDELQVLDDPALKAAAGWIDERLKASAFQTLVHGDAKLANFCFSEHGGVAAVDFQYVGGGCGMKDVAYFLGSCLTDDACERRESELLDLYFDALGEALKRQGRAVSGEEVAHEWRPLYPVAWTDFHRFLKGWSPGHWKLHSYSERLAHEVVQQCGGRC